MAKWYRISPVDYENAGAKSVIKDKYHYQEIGEIINFMGDWFDFPLGFDEKHKEVGYSPVDAYIYFDSIDELVPPMLTPADKKRLIAEIKKHLIKL